MTEHFSPLDSADLKTLLKKLRQRVGRMFFVCFCTALLPYAAVLAGMIFMQLIAGQAAKEGVSIGHYIPTSFEELKDFLIMAPVAGTIAYYGIIVYVAVYVATKILPVVFDLVIRRKRVINFIPETYQLPGCADFFLQTPFRQELFAKVSEAEFRLAAQKHEWQFQEARYSKVELYFAPLPKA